MRSPASAGPTRHLSPTDATILIAGYGLAVLAVAAMVLLDPTQADAWFGLLLVTAVVFLPVLVSCARREFDTLEPIFIVSASYWLYFVYAPAVDLLRGDEYFFGMLIPPGLLSASIHASIGIGAMLVGYYARIGTSIAARLPASPTASRGVVGFATLLGIVAVLAFGSSFAISGLSWTHFLTLGQLGVTTGEQLERSAMDSPFLNYLVQSADWFTTAFVLLFAFARRGRGALLPLFLAGCAVYTTIGFRYKLVILLLAPVVFWYLSTGRRPGLRLLLLSAVGAMLLIGGVGSQRIKMRAGERVELEELTFTEASEAFNRDVDLYQPFMAILDAYPEEHDFLWGGSYAYLAVHPIPRALWPDKPQPPVWEIVRASFGSDAARVAGVAYPNIGEFYVNAGLLGIVVGMAAFGIFLRALYAYTLGSVANPWTRVIYAIALPFLIQVVSRGYFVAIAQYTAYLFGPIVFWMWVASLRQPVTPPRPVPLGLPPAERRA